MKEYFTFLDDDDMIPRVCSLVREIGRENIEEVYVSNSIWLSKKGRSLSKVKIIFKEESDYLMLCLRRGSSSEGSTAESFTKVNIDCYLTIDRISGKSQV